MGLNRCVSEKEVNYYIVQTPISNLISINVINEVKKAQGNSESDWAMLKCGEKHGDDDMVFKKVFWDWWGDKRLRSKQLIGGVVGVKLSVLIFSSWLSTLFQLLMAHSYPWRLCQARWHLLFQEVKPSQIVWWLADSGNKEPDSRREQLCNVVHVVGFPSVDQTTETCCLILAQFHFPTTADSTTCFQRMFLRSTSSDNQFSICFSETRLKTHIFCYFHVQRHLINAEYAINA